MSRTKTNTGWCSVDGCWMLARSMGMCQSHYGKFKKYGDPLAGQQRKSHGIRTKP